MNLKFRSQSGILLLLLLCMQSAFGQRIFSGQVSDSKGEKVIGANIRSAGSTLAITNQDGKFSFRGNEESVRITISHLSYLPLEVTLTSGVSASITINEREFVSEEVNVIATRVNDKTGAAFQNIDKAELAKSNLGQDMPILLNYTPSLVTTSDAGTGIGYTGLRIRGSDATRVNVTINGVPVNDAESHQVYWVNIPDLASSVDNIQIQRGVGSSTNGAAAFGGSVNIQTNTLNSNPYATLQSSAGSFNTFRNTVSFGSGLLGDAFAFEGRLSKITSDGYIDRATSDLRSFYLSGGYYGKKNSLRAVILSGKEKTYQAWYGVPEDSLKTNRTYNPAGEYFDANGQARYYDNQTDNYQQDYYQLFYTREINSQWNANVALHYTRGKGYYEEYVPGAALTDYNLSPVLIGNDTIDETNITRQLWLSNHFYGGTWSLQYRGNNMEVIAGGALNEYRGDHFDEVVGATISPVEILPVRYNFDDAVKNDFNTYVKSSWFLESGLTAWVDLQYRNVRYSFTGPDNSYLNTIQNVNLHFFNPKAGLNYQIGQHYQVYLTYARAHKEPVRDDFLASIPANRPQPEEMNNWEFGYRFSKSAYRASINSYYMQYDNQLILNGRLNNVGEAIRESVPDSYRFGIEGESSYDNGKMFAYTLNMTWSRNKINQYTEYVEDYDGGPQVVNTYRNTTIAFSPSIIAAGIITIRPVKRLSIDICNKYVGKQYLDNTQSEERKLDPYYVNDLRFAYVIEGKKIKGVEFRLLVNNVLNAEYIANGATYNGYSGGIRYNYNYYYPQATRNYLAGVTIRF